MVCNTYAPLCLLPLSPQGAKARRATSMRREKGCAEFSNRWDESSVLVRYAFFLSFYTFLFFFPLILFFPFTFLCPLFNLSNFPVFQATFSSLCKCQFRFRSSPFLRLLFFLCPPPLALSLLFPLCLVLDTLPKTTSTPCFPLLTLAFKRQSPLSCRLAARTLVGSG